MEPEGGGFSLGEGGGRLSPEPMPPQLSPGAAAGLAGGAAAAHATPCGPLLSFDAVPPCPGAPRKGRPPPGHFDLSRDAPVRRLSFDDMDEDEDEGSGAGRGGGSDEPAGAAPAAHQSHYLHQQQQQQQQQGQPPAWAQQGRGAAPPAGELDQQGPGAGPPRQNQAGPGPQQQHPFWQPPQQQQQQQPGGAGGLFRSPPPERGGAHDSLASPLPQAKPKRPASTPVRLFR